MRWFVLGGGVTGLTAGMVSGLPVYEGAQTPGGICCSYYVSPDNRRPLPHIPPDGSAYRFEIGGGHWISCGDPLVLHFIRSLVPLKTYQRQSGVFLPQLNLLVPYPLQNHLRVLGKPLASQALQEMVQAAASPSPAASLADWLRNHFGPTLCELFFDPFHELYTAGCWKRIAPQDAYKTPVDLPVVIRGASQDTPPVGYNVTFVYPEEGLDTLARRLATRCGVRYGCQVVRIDVADKAVYFLEGSAIHYDAVLSTLPLNRVMEMTGLTVDVPPDPYTSVLVINIGAVKGPRCPPHHWLYIPRSRGGFHRVGLYSNVDPAFLPAAARAGGNRAAIYVERAYPPGTRPDRVEMETVCGTVVQELQEWGWIGAAEVIDPTWIDVAYTWSWPGSKWREKALKLLEQHDIYQIGRFARWVSQGIAASVREGLVAGSVFQNHRDH